MLTNSIYDPATGTSVEVPFTAAEIAAYEAEQAALNAPSTLVAYAAERRWLVETGGCPWNSYVIATDRDSQAKLIAEFVAMGASLRADPSYWKMGSGQFVSLTNAEMGAVVLAARTHIANAFATEAAVLAEIANGTITTREQIDAAPWPPNT